MIRNRNPLRGPGLVLAGVLGPGSPVPAGRSLLRSSLTRIDDWVVSGCLLRLIRIFGVETVGVVVAVVTRG